MMFIQLQVPITHTNICYFMKPLRWCDKFHKGMTFVISSLDLQTKCG